MNISDLNEMQQQAVRHTEGPLLIIAGAGSGKTKVLTYRIAYLIEECGVEPYNILAITFTNKAAGEMKERVTAITPEGGHVWVSTFHSMCVRILRRFAEGLGYTRDFAIYDTDDCKSIMKNLFKKNNVNTKYYQERGVLGAISSAKDELKSPRDMQLEAQGDFRLKTIADLYDQYQAELKANNAMDFDDLIFNTVQLFRQDPVALETYADRFHYIMVDEYQDTNTSQFQLVSLLAGKWRNLCVVGDDDQSIYKFRGANIENILSFERVFEGAGVIKLEQNYRSTTMILDAANSVIKNNGRRKGKKLWTGNEEGEKVSLLMFDNAYQEGEGIAAHIARLSRDGFSYDDFAVLYRTNAQSRILEEKLLMESIPYRIYGGVNFYQRREIKDILAYLKVIVNPVDGQSLRRIINVPRRGIGQTSIDRVQAYADRERISFYEALRAGKDIPDIGAASKKLEGFLELIEGFRQTARTASVSELAESIIEETGYMDHISSGLSTDEIADKQDNIDELFSKISDFELNYKTEEDTEDFAEYASTGSAYGEDANHNKEVDSNTPGYAEHVGAHPAGYSSLELLKAFLEDVSLVADTESGETVGEKVSLMTLHAAKGLEFPVVFMAGMEDGLFPGYMAVSMAGEDETEMEEERRLCYVGITRAKKKLYMTFARERLVRGERHTSRISRFVDEINPCLLDKVNHSLVGDNFGFGNADAEPVVIKQETQEKRTWIRGGFAPRNKAKFDFLNMGGVRKTPTAAPARKFPVIGGGTVKNDPGAQEKDRDDSNRSQDLPVDEGFNSDPSSDIQNAGTKKIPGTPGFGKDFYAEFKAGNIKVQTGIKDGSYIKPASSNFVVGDRVNNERFGDGTVTNVEDKGRDNLLTVEFDESGVKKMFEGFILLTKI